MQMPFGKHKGSMICEIDSAYLKWLLRECDNLDNALRDAVEKELAARGNEVK